MSDSKLTLQQVAEIEARIDSFPLSPSQARALCTTIHQLTELLTDATETETRCRELLQQWDQSSAEGVVPLDEVVRLVVRENERLTERLTEEVDKRVAAHIEKMNQTPIPPRTWPKPWWG